MLAAPAAIPPNPKIAAIIANITNVTVQRNIVCVFKVNIMGQYSLPFIQMSKYFSILLCGIQIMFNSDRCNYVICNVLIFKYL